MNEDAAVGTMIFNKILVKDRDTIGESLDLKCLPQQQSPEACSKYDHVTDLSISAFLNNVE